MLDLRPDFAEGEPFVAEALEAGDLSETMSPLSTISLTSLTGRNTAGPIAYRAGQKVDDGVGCTNISDFEIPDLLMDTYVLLSSTV